MDRKASAVKLRSNLRCMAMKRREEINNFILERRIEIQRRIRRRVKFLNKIKRMQTIQSSPTGILKQPTARAGSTDWWDKVVMKEFQPQDWLDKFHVSKDTFYRLLGKLKPQAEHLKKQLLPLEKRLAVTLLRLATSMDYGAIGDLLGVGLGAVGQCVREVCNAIVLLLKPVYIHLPSRHELEDNARAFHLQWGFPHCVGAIDSLHIPVKTASSQATDCWNRKGWHSVVLQGVVNGQGRFWDVCVGFPGGTDDLTILQSSKLWSVAREGGLTPQPSRKLLGRPLGYMLLGDAAYPLQSWLLKCYPESAALTPQQRMFNAQLSQSRIPIENAFQRLKARWQCLHKRNNCHLDLVPMMILACCILHNVCEVHNDPFRQEWLRDLNQAEYPQPSDALPGYMDEPGAEEVRTLLCVYFQQQQQAARRHIESVLSCPGVSYPILCESAEAAEMLTML